MILQSPYNLILLAILATVLFSTILLNNIVLFSTIAVVSFWTLFESDVDFTARKLCSCFKILREGKQDIRLAEWSPFTNWETVQQMQAGIDKEFGDCCGGGNLAELYQDRVVKIEETLVLDETTNWEEWQNFRTTFRPAFKKIAYSIDKQCPTLIRKIDDTWDEVLENTKLESDTIIENTKADSISTPILKF